MNIPKFNNESDQNGNENKGIYNTSNSCNAVFARVGQGFIFLCCEDNTQNCEEYLNTMNWNIKSDDELDIPFVSGRSIATEFVKKLLTDSIFFFLLGYFQFQFNGLSHITVVMIYKVKAETSSADHNDWIWKEWSSK